MVVRAGVWLLWAGLAVGVAGAQDSAIPLTPEELVELEQVRAAVEAALEQYQAPSGDGWERIENATAAAESLLPFGADVVRFLENELAQEQMGTFDFCAYVLARLEAPEAAAALRRAFDRADEGSGDRARARRAWAGWGLGLHGEVEILPLLSSGRHRASGFSMHANTTVLEAVALQNASESIPYLEQMYDLYADEPSRLPEVNQILGALRRIGSPKSVPLLTRAMGHGLATVRAKAAGALGSVDSPASVEPLMKSLGDEEDFVRRSVALGLERLQPYVKLKPIVKHLETEMDAITRGAIYRLMARSAPNWQRALVPHAGRERPQDRRYLIEALSLTGGVGTEVIEAGLVDPEITVGAAATRAVAPAMGDAAGPVLVAAIEKVNETVLQALAREVAKLDVAEAGAPLTARLLQILVNPRAVGPAATSVRAVSDALIDLRYTDAAERLQKALPRVEDSLLQSLTRTTIRHLETIRACGDSTEAWVERLATTPDHDTRLLVIRNLGRLGGDEVGKLLAGRFETLDLDVRANRDEAKEIVRAATSARSPALEELVARLLRNPDFDRHARHELRDLAAWAAWQIGDEQMADVLIETAERRNTRDFKVLVYAVLATPERALPLIENHRLERMHYLGWQRGKEQEALDSLARKVRQGWALGDYSVPPEWLQPVF